VGQAGHSCGAVLSRRDRPVDRRRIGHGNSVDYRSVIGKSQRALPVRGHPLVVNEELGPHDASIAPAKHPLASLSLQAHLKVEPLRRKVETENF
jgi:hypothetical protein